MFRPLTVEHVVAIARKMLAELSERVAKQQVWLEFREEAVRFIREVGYDASNGARPLARAIKRLVARPLSDELLSGACQPGDKVVVRLAGDQLAFTIQRAEPDLEPTN